jgi:hypothetical protein
MQMTQDAHANATESQFKSTQTARTTPLPQSAPSSTTDPLNVPLYLALDFDGVLHHSDVGPTLNQLLALMSDKGNDAFIQDVEKAVPLTVDKPNRLEGEGRLIDRQHHLEDLIERLKALDLFSDIRIVYSTSWRNPVPTGGLNTLLSPRIATHAVGSLNAEMAPLEREIGGQRGLRMMEWLKLRGESDAAFIALDDQARDWNMHTGNLVTTHWRGLNEAAVQQGVELAKALHLARTAPVALAS